jgi:hypothetical protein
MQTPPVRLSLAPGTTAHQLMAQGMPESSAYRVLKQGWYALIGIQGLLKRAAQ